MAGRPLIALVAAAFLLAASVDAAVYTITITNTPSYTTAYSPPLWQNGQLSIKSNDTVVWYCDDVQAHTVTQMNPFSACAVDPEPTFNGIDTFPEITCGGQGRSYNYTFPNSGRLQFFCTLPGHCSTLQMRGTIIIDGAPSTPIATPSSSRAGVTPSSLATRTPSLSPSRIPSPSRTATATRTPSPSPIACVPQEADSIKCPELVGWQKPAGAPEADGYWKNMSKSVCKYCKVAMGTPFICGYLTGLYSPCNTAKITNQTVFACRGQCDLLNLPADDPNSQCKWDSTTDVPELGGFLPFFTACSLMGGRQDCRLPCGDPDPENCPLDPNHVQTDEGKDLCKEEPSGLAAKSGPFPNWVFLFVGLVVICCCCVCCAIIIVILFPKSWILEGKLNPCKWCECCPYYWDI